MGNFEQVRVPEAVDNEPWRGNERRYRHDVSYSGPERRLAQGLRSDCRLTMEAASNGMDRCRAAVFAGSSCLP
jgi:hypothetical protein